MCGPVVNIEYKFVEPERIVPPDKVPALKDVNVPAPACTVPPIAVPENVILFTDGEAVKFIIGEAAVPPVVILLPAFTLFTPPDEPIVEKIAYKFVEPENIVPPEIVVAENVVAVNPPVPFVDNPVL